MRSKGSYESSMGKKVMYITEKKVECTSVELLASVASKMLEDKK